MIAKTLFQKENEGKNRARFHCEHMAFLKKRVGMLP
jgi:hypothetical protein